MSSPAGVYDDFVDTQDVVLDNLTDGNIYTQVKTVLPLEVAHDIETHNTRTGYVEKLSSLDDVSLDCRAILTEPDLPALMSLSFAPIPVKQWRVTLTSFDSLAASVTGKAKMFNFKILDRGVDVVMVEFRLEFESDISGLDTGVLSVS